MAAEQVPQGLTLFENYFDFIINAHGQYLFCALTKEKGGVVFSTGAFFYELPGTEDWGAPAIEWRSSDGQAIVAAVHQGGKGFTVYAVPGAFYNERLP